MRLKIVIRSEGLLLPGEKHRDDDAHFDSFPKYDEEYWN